MKTYDRYEPFIIQFGMRMIGFYAYPVFSISVKITLFELQEVKEYGLAMNTGPKFDHKKAKQLIERLIEDIKPNLKNSYILS